MIKLKKFTFVSVLVGVAVIVFWNLPFGKAGKQCTSEDTSVQQVAYRLQEYHRIHQEFPPDSNSPVQSGGILKSLKEEFPIDVFSLANRDEMYVYFSSNCKLLVRPDTFDTFSAR